MNDPFERYEPIPEAGCWLWTGSVTSNGYGAFPLSDNSNNEGAHRAFYRKFAGPIPIGKSVCHKCDTRRCVNPDHLFIGTHTDNMRDMIAKDRGPRGVRHGRAKLTDEQVLEIKNTLLPGWHMAKMFGVSDSAISLIRKGRRWHHLGERNAV